MSQSEIHQLLEKHRFEIETIAPLEKFVASGPYDFESDHALLKLYQFHPSKSNTTIISQILVRALAQIPACDFTQHLYLIPEAVQTTEAIANCIAAHECLERANFADFWARATGPLFESGDVKKRVRNFITDIVAKTYRVISVEQYSALVNLKDAELKAYISDLAAAGWKQVDNNLQIPTEAGTVKPKPTTEVLQFDQFTKLLAPLR